MSTNTSTAVVEVKEASVTEYIPHGAKDNVKLSISIVQRLVAVKTRTGKTCSDIDALKFIAMCKAKRMNPFEGDCFLIGYDGEDGPTFSMITAHQTYTKRAESSQEFDGMQSGIIVKDRDGKLVELEGDFFEDDQKVVGGWAKVFFKDRSHPMYKRLRLARFNTGRSIWKSDPAGMICKCAEADALRSSFPSLLGGLYMQAELEKDTNAALETARPIFGTERQIAETVPEQSARPEPEKPTINLVKAATKLCEAKKVPTEKVLEFIAGLGVCPDNVTTFEQLALVAPDALAKFVDQAEDILNRIAAEPAAAK